MTIGVDISNNKTKRNTMVPDYYVTMQYTVNFMAVKTDQMKFFNIFLKLCSKTLIDGALENRLNDE